LLLLFFAVVKGKRAGHSAKIQKFRIKDINEFPVSWQYSIKKEGSKIKTEYC